MKLPAELVHSASLIDDHPDSVRELRRLVVALAITGRLIGERSNASASNELLRLLDARHHQLVEDGKLTRAPALRPIAEADLPDVCPAGPLYLRLGDVARIEKGRTGIASATPGPYPLVVTAQDRASCDHFDFEAVAAIVPLVSSAGHGKASLQRLHYQEGMFALGTILAAVIPHAPELLSARFIFEYLTAFKDELLVSQMIGTANVTLTIGKVANTPIPLVPRTVQQKVDELMVLCDRLEAARAERETTRDRLAAMSLARLNMPDPETFHDDAGFALSALHVLTARVDQIKRLRQSVLNLAVRGKLVRQDPEDEPAQHLLARITTDRMVATESGGLKPITGIPVDSPQVDWDVPRGWVIAPLPAAVYFQEGPGLRNWQFRPTGIPFVNIRTLQNGRVNRDVCQYLAPDEVAQKYRHFLVREGDILCSTSGTIGKLAVVTAGDLPLMLNTSIVRFCAYGEQGPTQEFIKIFLGSGRFLGQAGMHVTGAAQVNMGPGHLKLMAFPLPPLAEQHRIVARVDELLTLCDSLELAIQRRDDQRHRLLSALLQQALLCEEAAEEAE